MTNEERDEFQARKVIDGLNMIEVTRNHAIRNGLAPAAWVLVLVEELAVVIAGQATGGMLEGTVDNAKDMVCKILQERIDEHVKENGNDETVENILKSLGFTKIEVPR